MRLDETRMLFKINKMDFLVNEEPLNSQLATSKCVWNRCDRISARVPARYRLGSTYINHKEAAAFFFRCLLGPLRINDSPAVAFGDE
jgi:hypothetical protein